MMQIAFVFLAGSSLLAADWDRAKALHYLDARQQQWADWKPAQRAGGPCLSCHTGIAYMLGRRAIGGQKRHPMENLLIDGVKERIAMTPPKTMFPDPGPESILALLTLSFRRQQTSDPLDAADRTALESLWRNQLPSGTWTWFVNGLDPVDTEKSNFYAASLAELALSKYPNQEHAKRRALRQFIQREAPTQPLHNQLAWIAFDARKEKQQRSTVLKRLWSLQSTDGGWTTAALGPWGPHPDAPPDKGSNAYATAWAAFAARQAGVDCNDKRLRKALAWLRTHQDPATGAWNSVSMNQVYKPGSIQLGFMTDAATGFAVAALASCP